MIKGFRTAPKKQGARRDAAVIGNIVHLRNKQDRAQWWTYIAWSRKGVGQGEFDLIGLNCGFCADDPKAKDAKAMREEMIAELKRYFKAVHVCANEVEQAHKLVELWPGEKSRRLEKSTVEDYASRPKEQEDTVEEYPQVPLDAPMEPGVHIMGTYHEHWCKAVNGGDAWECDCQPDIRRHELPTEH
jgi:hypothetical protein